MRRNKWLAEAALRFEATRPRVDGHPIELDGVVSEVIQLQAMSPDDAARHVSGLVDNLHQQSTEVSAFEREVVQV